jgi:V8-like Glu-specific endopeptidase
MKKIIRRSVGKSAKRPVKKGTKKTSKKTAKKAAKKTVKKTTRKAANKQAARAAKRSARRSSTPRAQEARGHVAPHYKRLLAGVHALGRGLSGGFESLGLEIGPAQPDLSESAIDERVEGARAELHRIVKEHLGDKPELYKVADDIADAGKPALESVRDEDEDKLASREILAGLEVIVRTDGSRPSFMVRNGEPDRTTSPLGTWGSTLDDSAELLRAAIACVGRIDDPSGTQGFQGTGILVQENLVITNRHVLQAIADQSADGSWKLKPDIAIDFGHEFRAQDSLRRREIKGVVFAGAKRIKANAIDHSKVDVALLELAPAAEPPDQVLALDLAPDWGQQETGVFIIGYPGNPGPFGDSPTLLEKLFKSTYGHKRLAPGLVTTAADQLAQSPRRWTLGHDATTLGGNSGSAVVVIGREIVTAGLHYGGRRAEPRENWCHVLGLTLDETDGRSDKTLRQHLQEWGVELVDRQQ